MSPRLPTCTPKESTLGIRCPKCSGTSHRVVRKKKRTYGIGRRLECRTCGKRFPSKEIAA